MPSSREVPWYTPNLEYKDIQDVACELLVKYSKVPNDQVVPHIVAVRERAFDIFPYPCLGQFRFLFLSIQKYAEYPEVLERIKNGEKFLDLGCALGQEIRKLVFDGAPSKNIYGSDLRMDFMNMSYDLFNDRDSLKSKFIVADIFDPESDLKELDGKISIVFTGAFFHLFDYAEQFTVAKRIVSLLDPNRTGLILGRQVGNLTAREYSRHQFSANEHKTRFRHNPESWGRFWDEVGEATGTKWSVTASLGDIPNFEKAMGGQGAGEWNPKDSSLLTFSVRQVK